MRPSSPDGKLDHLTGYIRVRELFVQNLTISGYDLRTLIRPVLHIDKKPRSRNC